ncbi:NADPH oxidase 5 [Dermatophagoides farinae]|uniref:NADPH oxidase 5 n=1 Tax=Dermatophagoides farinae TaxID=6954 RepID=A0A922ICE1_DERFA|nr:NADPH oxidase 5 [Dermatophagoides farinae]
MTLLFHKLRWGYIRNNFQSFFFTIIYIAITLSLFIYRFGQYADTTIALAIARASAIAIYGQSGLIIVLILRKSISYVRSFGLARYFPLDHYVYFHKVTGWSIAFFSLVHTLAHLYNFAKLTNITTISYIDFLVSVNLGIGWFFGSACLTGWILVIILVVMLIFSMNFIRRTGNFEVFYYSHKLYVFYILVLFLHASSTLHWLTAPLIFLLFEKISAYYRTKKYHHGQTYVIEGTMLPSRVIRLIIRKPKYFHFVPGDFVYMMVPSITKYEWHPMTISSAPEDKELTLHIRAVGEWTNRLYDHFDNAKTLTLKKMLEEWKCLDFHPLFKDTDPINKFDINCGHHHSAGSLMQKRTMILPVPEDCDEDGCGKIKKQISIEHSDSESESGSDVQTNAVFLKEPLKIHLDGPYGAPSSNIFESEHAVLVATGIGVTPFASILQSIMYRHIEKTRHCPLCNHSWTERVPSRHINNLKKVDFIWINRNQTSFEWFVEMLSDLVEQQSTISIKDDRFFDIHMYVTNKDGEKSNDHNQRTKGSSIIDRSHSMINWHFGRPEWNSIFHNIRQQKRGKVTFFYCGRPDLSGYLRQKCNENDFVFKKEVF